MQILSHRGYWKESFEKNSMIAFERSFLLGFGTETDIRDLEGELVISHDMPTSNTEGLVTLKDFLRLYKLIGNDLPLALNIKSDGLQESLKELLQEYKISNYFVFDMSIPDTIGYINQGINFFTRQSEYENIPALYEKSKGVWMDEFNTHWITSKIIIDHLLNNKFVCIVSPELHKRNNAQEWINYKKIINNPLSQNFLLCTDTPEIAKKYFYEN